MRISQLAERTEVPVHTLKYYLREGLLMPGEARGATRAEYGEEHVDRVRLIRALVEHGEVPIAGVRSILDAIGSPPEAVHELLGVAHCALPTPPTSGTLSPDVADLVADLGWHVDPGSPALHWFSDTVGAARAVGVPLDRSALRRYSEAMRQVAAVDVDTATAGGSVAAATRMVAVGTTMLDPMLTALRRVAQEAESADRFGWGDDDGPVGVDRAVIET